MADNRRAVNLVGDSTHRDSETIQGGQLRLRQQRSEHRIGMARAPATLPSPPTPRDCICSPLFPP